MGAWSGNRLGAADRALNRYYTSAVGGRASPYERETPDPDYSVEEAIMARHRQAERAAYDETRSALAALSVDVRDVLASVYGRGAGVVSSEAGHVKGIAVDRAGLLRIALQPTWGHGTYVRLALSTDRALRAYAKRHPDAPQTADRVLDYLCDEAGKGSASERFLAALRDDCEQRRSGALAAFDEVRRERLRVRREVEDAVRQRELEAAERLHEQAARRRREGHPSLAWTDEYRAWMREQALRRLAELDALGKVT